MSRRTARFEKIVLTPGEYYVAYNGSTKVKEHFSAERLAKMAETGQQMIENGLKIPVPFVHFDKNSHTPTPVTLSDNGQEVDPLTGKPIQWDASINGGFAEAWYQNEDGALVAVMESFGDENDVNTPAGKIGTICQETSIGLAKKYMDGKGNVYEDAPIHIAACIKAVEPNQSNFVLLNDDDVSKVSGDLSIVSMSSQLLTMADPSTINPTANGDKPLTDDSSPENGGENLTCDVPTLLNLLRKLESPIDLPADTTIETLVERLCIAVNQKICDEESSEEIEPGEGNAEPKPPQNAQEKQGTITMSDPVVTPGETKPNQESVLLMSMFANQQKVALESRIKALKDGKQISEDVINEFVTPHMGLDLTTMSIADFDQTTGKVKSFDKAELAISILEKQAANVITMSLDGSLDYFPQNGTEIGYSEPNNLSDEDKENMKAFGEMLING